MIEYTAKEFVAAIEAGKLIPDEQRQVMQSHSEDWQMQVLQEAETCILANMFYPQQPTRELEAFVEAFKQENSPKGLPKELATDEAKALLEKAKAAGFLDEAYKWNGTQQLAAYFAYRASQSLNLSNKQDNQGNLTTCWKPFETLFGYEAGKRVLSTAKANWMRLNTKFEPPRFEQIDALFTT